MFKVLAESSCNNDLEYEGGKTVNRLQIPLDQAEENKGDCNKKHNKPEFRCPEVQIFSDSHGRNLAKFVKANLGNMSVCSSVKPGAKMNDVIGSLKPENVQGDYVVIIGGTNDIAYNEGDICVSVLEKKLTSLGDSKVLVVNIPVRHDLIPNSCVNKAVVETNEKITRVCKGFRNVTVFDTSVLDRAHHTRHGMHLNKLGKEKLCKQICEYIKKDQKIISAHCKPTAMQGYVSSEVGSTGVQLTSNQTIVESKEIEARLPSKHLSQGKRIVPN